MLIYSKTFKFFSIIALLCYIACFFIYPHYSIAIIILTSTLMCMLLSMKFSSKRDRKGRNRYGFIYGYELFMLNFHHQCHHKDKLPFCTLTQ